MKERISKFHDYCEGLLFTDGERHDPDCRENFRVEDDDDEATLNLRRAMLLSERENRVYEA